MNIYLKAYFEIVFPVLSNHITECFYLLKDLNNLTFSELAYNIKENIFKKINCQICKFVFSLKLMTQEI